MQRERGGVGGGGGLGMNFFVYYNKWSDIKCSFNKWSDIKQVLFLL